jgi:hypothetical protein
LNPYKNGRVQICPPFRQKRRKVFTRVFLKFENKAIPQKRKNVGVGLTFFLVSGGGCFVRAGIFGVAGRGAGAVFLSLFDVTVRGNLRQICVKNRFSD